MSSIQVYSVILRHQVEILKAEANRLLPTAKQLSLKFSKGRLDGIQKRKGIKFRRVYSKALSADGAALNAFIPDIESKVAEYGAKFFWNADEFSLFYRPKPGLSLFQKSSSSSMKDKTRISFLSCCHVDETERFPLMVIGKALRPAHS
eukprot:IDg7778t1